MLLYHTNISQNFCRGGEKGVEHFVGGHGTPCPLSYATDVYILYMRVYMFGFCSINVYAHSTLKRQKYEQISYWKTGYC